MKEPGTLKVVGAHDALSAHLIKRAASKASGPWLCDLGFREMYSQRQLHDL